MTPEEYGRFQRWFIHKQRRMVLAAWDRLTNSFRGVKSYYIGGYDLKGRDLSLLASLGMANPSEVATGGVR